MKFSASLAATLLVATVAQAKPTGDEVKRVLDFYYNGRGTGVVLVDAKLCGDIAREGDQKNECADPVADNKVVKGKPIYIWMQYLIPEGDDEQKILVQFDNGGITRLVKDLTITSSLRYRAWRKVSFDKTGSWTAKIVHDSAGVVQPLGEVSFTVVDE